MEAPDALKTSSTSSTSASSQFKMIEWSGPNWETVTVTSQNINVRREAAYAPKFKNVPPMLSTDRKRITENPTYAFICDCAAPNREYFCEHIFNLFRKGGDFPLWAARKDMKMTIFIPVVLGVLYHVDVETVTIPTWDGNEKTKILIRPGNNILSERFVDSIGTVMHRIGVAGGTEAKNKDGFSTVLESLRREVIEHVEEAPRANEIANLIGSSFGNPSSFCKSTSHDYGIIRRFKQTIIDLTGDLDLNRRHTNLTDFIKLNSYTGYLYDMCFLCYENHTSLFHVTTL